MVGCASWTLSFSGACRFLPRMLNRRIVLNSRLGGVTLATPTGFLASSAGTVRTIFDGNLRRNFLATAGAELRLYGSPTWPVFFAQPASELHFCSIGLGDVFGATFFSGSLVVAGFGCVG